MSSPLKQCNMPRMNKSERGAILIELAIVLIVIGLMLAAATPYYKTYIHRNAMMETQKRLDIIETYLSNYIQQRWRIPCPADPSVDFNATATDEPFGTERGSGANGSDIGSCDANAAENYGILPYRTLGLPEEYAKDGWGNFFTYAVSSDFTADTRLGISPNQVNLRYLNLVTTTTPALLPLAQFCAPLGDNVGNDITVLQDGQSVFDNNTVGRTTTEDVPKAQSPDANFNRQNDPTGENNFVTSIALVILSHGENGFGSYQNDGNQFRPAAGGANEDANNTQDRQFIFNPDVSTNTANEYDDILRFYTQDTLFSKAGGGSCEHL